MLIKRAKKYTKAVLKRTGLRVNYKKLKLPLGFKKVDGARPIRVHKPKTRSAAALQAFVVPLDKVVTCQGFTLGPEGWHPYTQTLHEYRADPRIAYQDTTLARYYEVYQPRSVREVLFDEVPVEHQEELNLLERWPAVRELYNFVWALDRDTVEATLKPHGRKPFLEEKGQHFGPANAVFAAWLRRTRASGSTGTDRIRSAIAAKATFSPATTITALYSPRKETTGLPRSRGLAIAPSLPHRRRK